MKYIHIIVIGILLTCCGKADKNSIVFTNDFESVKGWSDVSRISDDNSHSGRFSTYMDTVNRLSKAFKLKFRDIGPGPFKKVRYSVWCKTNQIPAKGSIIISIGNDAKPNIIYAGSDFDKFISKIGRWGEVTGEVDLTINQANDPNNDIIIYAINLGAGMSWADDFTIEFIK